MPRLNPPQTVLEIAGALEQAGYETWCVGGAVRDALLGHPHLDWDLATSATPDVVQGLFGARRTIPVGIEFGTVKVLDRRGTPHEVTTFRRDVKTDGRHAVVEFGASLDEDLARRDFTINAIAYSPNRDELRDPFGGRRDLENRLVRAVGDAETRMREDRLRALRAIRFGARFGFSIHSATMAAIRASAPQLGRLSAERVKQELEKTMDQVRRPAHALTLWRDTGALRTLVPLIADIDDAALAALDCLAMPGPAGRPQRRLTRLAALFLDAAGDDTQRALVALRFSRRESTWIASITERWRAVVPQISDLLAETTTANDAQVRRWVALIGRLHVGPVMRLASAHWAAARDAGQQAPPTHVVRSLHRRLQRAAFQDPVEIRDLAVHGDDLLMLGIPAGPKIRRILQRLLDAVLADPSYNTRDWLLREARRLQEQDS